MRRVAKSRGAPRVVAAAHKSSDDATTNVEAEKHQPNANAIAGAPPPPQSSVTRTLSWLMRTTIT